MMPDTVFGTAGRQGDSGRLKGPADVGRLAYQVEQWRQAEGGRR